MKAAEAHDKLDAARVARLASVRPDGSPHLIPIVFSTMSTGLVTAIDGKPKRQVLPTRIRNVIENPRVSVLVDEYREDWSQLWWVRVDGVATLHYSGPTFESGKQALINRYEQYGTVPIPGPLIHIEIERITGWNVE